MAQTKDPTVKSARSAPSDALDGVHPARPISEADDAAVNKSYKDNPDKPDPSTVAQVEVLPEDK